MRSFTEFILRFFTEFTLRSFALLRMTGCEGLRVTVEGFRMTRFDILKRCVTAADLFSKLQRHHTGFLYAPLGFGAARLKRNGYGKCRAFV